MILEDCAALEAPLAPCKAECKRNRRNLPP